MLLLILLFLLHTLRDRHQQANLASKVCDSPWLRDQQVGPETPHWQHFITNEFIKIWNICYQYQTSLTIFNIFCCIENKNNFYLIVIYCKNIVIDIYYIDMICLFNMLVNFWLWIPKLLQAAQTRTLRSRTTLSQHAKHFSVMGDYNSPR